MNKRLNRTIVFITTFIVIIFAVFSIFSAIYERKELESEINEKIVNETIKNANMISMKLERAEGTVDTIAAAATESFDMRQYSSDSSYIDDYMVAFDPIIKHSLSNMKNATGLFYTFNIDLVNNQEGYEIWYVYDKDKEIQFLDAAANGVYEEAFSQPNAGYMQFYFQAIKAHGEGVWTGPIYDPDIAENILTCPRPLALVSNTCLTPSVPLVAPIRPWE